MPEQFDPAWEYFSCDPEIEELVNQEVKLGWDKDGFRFSRRPDALPQLHLAPEKPEKPRGRPRLPDKRCPTCKEMFHPKLSKQRYCSRKCIPLLIYGGPGRKKGYKERGERGGRPRVLPDIHCLLCGKCFRPRSSHTKYCSLKCLGRRNKRRVIWDPRLPKFVELYMRGVPLSEIEVRLGLSEVTIVRWRRKEKLPLRRKAKRMTDPEPTEQKEKPYEHRLLRSDLQLTMYYDREPGMKPIPAVFQYSKPEDAVLDLLPLCTPEFLNHLKSTQITMIQNEQRGIQARGDVGQNAINPGSSSL